MEEKIELVKKRSSELSNDRIELLNQLAQLILEQKNETGYAKVIFVCTHNSRRSQLAELMLHNFSRKEGLNYIMSFSTGTEATAFNHRMVHAVNDYGIVLDKFGDSNNPLYITQDDHYLFSKRIDDPFNPTEDFIAVTVCSDADQNCPFIPGTSKRMHLGYVDPKHSDDTEKEKATYFRKVIEIGSEMYYLINQLKTK